MDRLSVQLSDLSLDEELVSMRKLGEAERTAKEAGYYKTVTAIRDEVTQRIVESSFYPYHLETLSRAYRLGFHARDVYVERENFDFFTVNEMRDPTPDV